MTNAAHAPLATVAMTYTTLERICQTELVPKHYRNKPDAALAAVLMGRELGLAEMQSLSLIDVIDGRPALSAELQNAMIRRAGHSIEVVELTAQGCTLKGTRADTGDTATVTFALEDADTAGLAGKRNYQSYPTDMYFARAISRLARVLFPDVLTVHSYTPQDLDPEAVPDSATAIVDADEGSGRTVDEAVENVEAALGPVEVVYDGPDLEAALVVALADPPDAGTMPEIETRLRTLCRLASELGIVHGRGNVDYLHAALADVGAAHVSELRKAELGRLTTAVRHEISDRFADFLTSNAGAP